MADRILTPRGLDAELVSVGAAAPALRLAVSAINSAWGRTGGRGQVAACRSDEDTLTLAASAASRALGAAGVGPGSIDGLWWGTSRLPFAEGPSWSTLAASLRLDTSTDGTAIAGSPHSGVDALLAAADAVAAGRVRTALVVASEALRPALGSGHETAAGAGAVALVLRRDGAGARLDSVASRFEPLLDRYRGDDETETRDTYDSRLVREEAFMPLAADVIGALGMHPDTRWSLADPDGRLAKGLSRKLKLGDPVSAAVRTHLGDLGAAAPLAGLVAALGESGPAALLAWGGGRATALGLAVDEPVPGAPEALGDLLAEGMPADYARVLRSRGQLEATGESVEMAIPPGSAMFVRDLREVLGLLGARCVNCGVVNLPPSAHPSCPGCGGDKFDVAELPHHGTVQTFVVNQTMPAPFEAPLPLVVVDLDDGSRVQLQGSDDGSALEVGMPVELVLRRYTIERGVPVYGWKVAT
ncbi:MAG: hypothetical protein GY812_13795 [Actinomycetia bacterium]|nr:hypothetical protein [Actinomycetes bacterium]